MSSKTIPTWQSVLVGFGNWCRREPLGALLLLTIAATIFYFYWEVNLFLGMRRSVGLWAWEAWSPEGNQEHSKLVLPIFAVLLYLHRGKLKKAAGPGSAWGLVPVIIGIVWYLLGARMIEARYGILSIPFLVFGSVWFLFGLRTARVILFPCAFFIFAIPMGAIEQATHRLQFIITGTVGVLSNLVGIHVIANGTSLVAADNAFNFEIAEGCSGVRSLIAMAMLTSVYAHLTQKELWKKLVVFFASAVFAIIGNIGRIFTIILIARFIDKDWASGPVHDYSAFIFFPIALFAMLGFSRLLNTRFPAVKAGASSGNKTTAHSDPVSYDY